VKVGDGLERVPADPLRGAHQRAGDRDVRVRSLGGIGLAGEHAQREAQLRQGPFASGIVVVRHFEERLAQAQPSLRPLRRPQVRIHEREELAEQLDTARRGRRPGELQELRRDALSLPGACQSGLLVMQRNRARSDRPSTQ
jgi:hypothetical protein